MKFKKLAGLGEIPYEQQLYIAAFSRCSCRLRGGEKLLRRVCEEVGGEDYSRALWRVMTTGDSVRRVAMDCYMSEALLYRLRNKAYRMLWKELFITKKEER